MKNSFNINGIIYPYTTKSKLLNENCLSKPGIIQSVLKTFNGESWFDHH